METMPIAAQIEDMTLALGDSLDEAVGSHVNFILACWQVGNPLVVLGSNVDLQAAQEMLHFLSGQMSLDFATAA